MSDVQRPPDRLTIDISIEGGNVTPTNEQVQGKVNEPIVLRVNSDAADELHVHSVPEHTFRWNPTTVSSSSSPSMCPATSRSNCTS